MRGANKRILLLAPCVICASVNGLAAVGKRHSFQLFGLYVDTR